MRIALVNPAWDFTGSIYFGCQEPHLPLELGAAGLLLERAGHEVLLLDGQYDGLTNPELADRVAGFAPAMTVVTTAPSYLFWRCPPPELRSPRDFVAALDRRGGLLVAIGPHGSATPGACLRKLDVDYVIRGEPEETLVTLAQQGAWADIPGTARLDRDGGLRVTGRPQMAHFRHLPPLTWPAQWIAAHTHHHHRFDTAPHGLGAETESSRGCPYACTFCSKIDFRDNYRRRDLPAILAEVDRLVEAGVAYLYFIDEIFLPNSALLDALAERKIQYGIQTRLDLWKPAMIEKLGRSGCVSIEAGVESLTEAGRAVLDKDCRMSTEALTERLVHARNHVPFVQANLIATESDDPAMIGRWRDRLRSQGVWANDPVPLFAYPSSPEYRARWGEPDDDAWERALDHYLGQFDRLSDIQSNTPLPLHVLESQCHHAPCC